MTDAPNTTTRFISATCKGEVCALCGDKAAAKIGEEISSDDPRPIPHNRTAYICATHFYNLMGSMP